MNQWVQVCVTVLCSVIASSGFWAFLQKRRDRHDANTQLLIGIAHDIIVNRGMHYLERGDWITRDEYENLHDYLYIPYKERGGNGSAERVMTEIDNRLRLVDHIPLKELEEEEKLDH